MKSPLLDFIQAPNYPNFSLQLCSVVVDKGVLFGPKRQIVRLGLDSFVVLIVYLIGAIGLVAITSK